MGIDRPRHATSSPPFTLGVTDIDPLTMAGAYATFAARGEHCEPRPVTAILNSNGKVIEDYPERVQAAAAAPTSPTRSTTSCGASWSPAASATTPVSASNQPSAGKTGTINGNKAVWFVGYTPNLATAAMIAGANSKGHPITLNGQTVGGVYIAGRARLAPTPARCGATR